ncbi:uncharacterized protein LOC103361291 [Stegastes partitus]|uniref:Uncharacterized protein LOC103361291 n=1 Tax=Stegastes partitus TaxID=144197 RepID=A0A9Y4N5F1_9TELE|nr:PREDICTED: uncharacterized protein LOC103361291 [Stegastes partitus]
MDALKLSFLLLLPLTVFVDAEVTLVKTIGDEADVTPLCSNETFITLIVCKIRTERNRQECRLLYKHGHFEFEHGCDSGFSLIKDNQIVFLHLSSLEPADSGNYTCECSYHGGTYILHLNVTVEDSEDASPVQMMTPYALIGGCVVIIVTLILLGFIFRRRRRRKQPESASCPSDTVSQDIEPYSTYRQTGSGLYSTVKIQPRI